MTRAAVGLRVHSGWAALVAVAGVLDLPVVTARQRIELADAAIPGSRQPYHAAQRLDLKRAEELVKRCTDGARRLARQGLHAALDELREKGHDVVGCGILLASGRPTMTLAATLASHALIHTAEGELFRAALIHASEQCDLPVFPIKERELFARAATQLRLSGNQLGRRMTEMGRMLGPPWRQDEKYAALVGWLALAGSPLRQVHISR